MGITRDDVVNDRIRKRLAAEANGIENLLSEAEFERTRADVLKQFESENELWIFGYGSLIWSPTFNYVEQAVAELPSCSRKFCLWAHTGRGSPEQPGLWLGLDTGGSCTGIAFRVDNSERDYETLLLWRREMVSGAYMPRVLPVIIDGQEKACICLLANKSHKRYAGELPFEKIVECIATGCGHLGTCEEYLFNLIEKLDSEGVHDAPMHELAVAVRSYPAQSNG